MLQLKNFLTLVRNTPLFNIIVMLILLTYPALLLTVRSSMGVLFGVMLIISVAYLYSIRKTLSVPHWDGYSIAFALAMASPVAAIFLSQAYHGEFDSPHYDWASRFLLSIPIFLALRQTNIRAITVLQYGIPLGALTGLIMLRLHPFEWYGRSTTSSFFNLIHFSNTALIIGFLSLFSINWEHKDHPLVMALKLSGFMAGVYMSIQSGERGGWLAIPLLLLLWVVAHSKKNIWLTFGIATFILISAAWLSYSMIDVIHNRVDSIFSDIHKYTYGDKDTSIGIRYQLYLAAIHLFIENPVFGIGPGGFSQAMPALTASGMVTPLAGLTGTAEVHNEILHKCAETGLFGLLSILSVYLVPILIFWRSTKSSCAPIRISGFMGICLVFGFFIFGLTVEIFDLKMTATFFAFTLAVLMSSATHPEASRAIISIANIEVISQKSQRPPRAN
jgi:O-antigen ligase